ncbi:Leucine-rich repeat protein kinase family protein, putative [Theobroma cacao]|uniref:non-specific serine/threonine protein kinase n=1 Tax=Theobroma cacao TaxID=3641 RepID=A0A061FFP3_THECC|nr:Leucine-rich repeat protein kinase family protein, putative [Theobroma cacao]
MHVEISPTIILVTLYILKGNIIFLIYNSKVFLSQVPLPLNFMGNTRFILALILVVLLPNFEVSFSMKSTTNIKTDQLALLAIKAHVNSDLLATNWSTATSICNWVGVTCGSRHHRVIALDLFGMNLSGTIPPDMGNLSFVAFLDMGNNSFHGSLPIELANLRRLKYLILSNNNFNGRIPSWFGSFSKLQNLSLNGNNFEGVIPSSLCFLSKLEILRLDDNNLQGHMPMGIGNLSNLRFLYLQGNQLSGSIPSSVFNISSLLEIVLRNNQLTGSIPSISLNMSSLQVIDFTFNNLTGHISSNTFDGLPKLKGLHLSFNQLSGPISMSIFKCHELEYLSLSHNHLEGTIPKEIGNLTMLKGLYLGHNNLKGEIPQQIGNLTLLKVLTSSYNKLTGKIPLEIGNLPTLEILNLGSNSISGHIPPHIFNSSTVTVIALDFNYLSNGLPGSTGLWLPKLEWLLLGINDFNGTIPSSVSNASKLKMFDLSHNSFSGYIPNNLGNLRDLQVLNLQDNYLAHSPSSPELSFLSSLAHCKDLRMLNFYDNPFIDGELPISIGNLSISLEELDASHCNIRGNIPREIGNLINLISLYIANNSLIGTIPTTIERLEKLQGLSLQGNTLEGSIPFELCHLQSLGYLYLTGNKLSGPIPECLGDLVSLRHLYLGSNEFTNSIPSTFTRLIDILQLNLSSNFLSGALPVDIGKWKVVISIDFSKNQLLSEIPSSIGDLEDLTYLSLSGNRLYGSIPELFGGLIGLEFLDLSRNNFYGIIPKSLQKLLHLKYLNVSYNRLHGEIPNRGPFANYSIQSFIGNEALCGAPRLQLPPCTSNYAKHSRKATKLIEFILLPVGSTLLILALIAFYFQSRRKHSKQKIGRENSIGLANWRRISYQELHQATNGFCESKLLGVGSFGFVYQGTFSDGLNIAIKVFNLEVEGSFKSFDVECEVLRNIRHRNLVKIISSCCNVDFKALVLEFMPNGSLEKWLYSHNYFLDMLHRLNIMIDVASALEYLHHGQIIPVAHCDLKPSNVLLDEDMVAHLGDFGIAKLLGEEDSTVQTITLATIGYMAPEYGTQGIVSIKGDVYSFGILVIETLTRKKPTDEMFIGEMSLKHWVNESIPSALTQVVDANLLIGKREREHFAIKDCTSSVLQLALECLEELPEERIDMKNVVAKLKKIKIKFLKDSNRQA